MVKPQHIELIDDIYDFAPEAFCRHEDCPVVEAHLAHRVHSRRGRPSSLCPNCLKSVQRTQGALRCASCGWERTKED